MRQPPKHMAECAPLPDRQMHSRTKIVATLVPSTDSIEVLTEMVRVGLDVARVNFSHGKHEEHGRRIDLVHEAARRAGRYVGILADLGGPKIRIESFTNKKVDLKEGQAFALDTAHDPNAGNDEVVGCISAPALSEKDREDIKFAASKGADYIAVSFARDAADMNLARSLLRLAG